MKKGVHHINSVSQLVVVLFLFCSFVISSLHLTNLTHQQKQIEFNKKAQGASKSDAESPVEGKENEAETRLEDRVEDNFAYSWFLREAFAALFLEGERKVSHYIDVSTSHAPGTPLYLAIRTILI